MRSAEALKTMDGMEYIASLPTGEIIIGMSVYNNELFVASEAHVYVLKDKKRLELDDG